MKEELGDLLLQVVFHAQIAKDRGEFDINDVIDKISDKMVRAIPMYSATPSSRPRGSHEAVARQKEGRGKA